MPTNAEPRRHALANLSRPLCVIDTEWTHASVADARLISVAIARLLPGGETVLREWVINPGVPIDPATTAVHGMTDADVKDLPPFAAVAFEIADFLEDADIGGYSVASDIQILERELDAAEHPLRTAELRIVDPLRLWQKREPRKLTNAYERFVGPIPESLRAHDALDDVRMTLAVIERMAGDRSAGEMHAEAHPRMVDPAGKFVRDDQDRIAFAFGKHRGDPVDRHPDFLDWMLRKDFAPSTLAVARAELDRLWAPAAPADAGDSPAEGAPTIDGDIPF